MGKKKVTRLVSLVLAFLFLFSCATVAVSASAVNDSVTDKTIEDYIDALGTDSYQKYVAEQFAGVSVATKTVSFDANLNWVFENAKGEKVTIVGDVWTLTDKDGKTYNEAEAIAAGFKMVDYVHFEEHDGKKALYTPNLGSVTWKLNLSAEGLTEAALYNITLDYYPVVNETTKTTSIERGFFVNGKALFSEARSLTLPKRWASYKGSDKSVLVASYTPDKRVQKEAGGYDAALALVGDAFRAAGVVAYLSEDKATLLIEQPTVITKTISELLEKYEIRFFVADIMENELRPTMVQDPEWMTYTLQDASGFYSNPFGFMLAPDENGVVEFTLEGVNEPVVISAITLSPYTEVQSYDSYMQYVKSELGTDRIAEGTDKIKIEAEYTTNASTNVVYPVEDRSDANTSPTDTGRSLLNTIGTEKWVTPGQWVQYRFRVDNAGMYEIFTRFKQSFLDGMYVCRMLKIYTADENGKLYETVDDYKAATGKSGAGYYNGVPFDEATKLRYDYGSSWQVKALSTGSNEDESLPIYLESGVNYVLHFEVTLGSMSGLIRQIENILDSLNEDYLSIIKLTGSSPDDYRDYSFYRLLPNTMIDMIIQSEELAKVSKTLKEDTVGVASSYTGVCDQLSNLLEDMGKDEDAIAKNLSNLKSYVGSLGTFLTDAKTQPLQFDYLMIQGSSAEAPKGKAGFFKSLGHEISSFFMSFIRDYNSMGATGEIQEGGHRSSVNVWLAYGRDQSQVIRNLCTNEFTPNSKNQTAVDLKLVAAGTLLPSILAGMGPDVYIGLGQTDVINYAIRGALANIEGMEGFDDIAKNFNEAAMMVLGTVDSDGDMHYYGLPETQGFPMMFIRTDILANLEIEIPKTWGEIYTAQSVLEANNMEIGVTTDYKIFLYQLGGELFADEGMRINLDSIVGLEAFDSMCNMFTQFSFPYQYDAANRFRTGEMPIIVANYTELYNHLKVFATELDNNWAFFPLPGFEQADGTINNCSVSSASASVLIKKDNEEYEAGWEFLKWYTDAPCQVKYAEEMIAILGDSAKHSTANYEALASMPWTYDEYAELAKQFNNLAAIPNYPGYYIIERYTNFAFMAAYNDDADPKTELLSYINIINKEITRKREEFKLETLEIGQKLSEKRADQTLAAIKVLEETFIAEGNTKYAAAIEAANYAIANDRILQLRESGKMFADILAADWDQSKISVQKVSGAVIEMPSYYINVGKQTAEPKNGGYSIDSLNEQQLVYFISECLFDIADALESY